MKQVPTALALLNRAAPCMRRYLFMPCDGDSSMHGKK
jgi:hypothetical protein